jgi:hypothetical protein
MKRILLALALCLCAGGALAQGVAQPANQFWATPTGGPGFLGLRPIALSDISALLTFTNTGGTAACVQLPALSGDITSSGCVTTLPQVNTNVGTWGGANSIPNFTVNGKGLVTAAGSNTPAIPFSELTGSATCAQMPAETGDVTSPAGSCANTLATVNATPGTFGGANSIPTFTSTGKGLFTASGAVTPSIPFTELTGSATCAQEPAFTGDVTTPAGSCAHTLATVNGNVGSFGSSTAIPSITFNGKGLATAAITNAVIAPAGTLTGTTLNSPIVTSSLTSVGKSVAGVPGIQIGVPGALFDGATDDTAAINTAISNLYTAGGGTLYLPAGTTVVNTSGGISMRSFVNVVGTEGTVIKCGTNTGSGGCVTGRANWQLIKSGMSHVKFVAGASNTTGTVLNFTSVNYSDFGWLSFSGFTAGIALNINMTTGQPTNFDDAGENGNIIFNSFHDWQMFENSGIGRFVQMGGHYSAGTTIDSVVTQNEFRNLNGKYSVHCFDIIKATDTNYFVNNLCRTDTQGTAAIVLGDDPVNTAVPIGVEDNVFVNQIFSAGPAVTGAYAAGTSGMAFWAGSWTFGNVAWSFNSDVPQASIEVDVISSPQGNCFYGTGAGLHKSVPAGMYFARFCDGPGANSGTQAWDNTAFTVNPANNATVLGTTTQGFRYLILTNSVTATSYTIQMPCSARDGDLFTISSNGPGATTLTMNSCPTQATTIFNPFTTLGQGTTGTWRLIGNSLSWVKVS